ncbi:MAG TPA: CrcB family protein, partial [Fibrobacteria bacterium]|nr:CrcB family protein [Fibrobacteria bacterium]
AWLETSPLAPSLNQQIRALLLTGVLGGFTTFSTFSLENVALLRAGEWRLAALYMLVSHVFGIGLALGGWWGMRLLLRPD